jgi:hypothetical protein
MIGLLPGCYTVAPTRMSIPGPKACSTDAFEAVRLQNQVRPSIVRIESDVGVGTGFVVKHQNGVLIATNYHVVRSGLRFDAIFDSGARLKNLEVVKVDVKHDLALLMAPGISDMAPGLELSSKPVVLAEHIAAIGYPYVAGETEPSLTFEEGSVTNAKTELDGRTYVRTNANINPGNSGGPMIDACAQVVGVVVGVHLTTQRTGLIIPVADLRALLAVQDAPRDSPGKEIALRITTLETAVRSQRGQEVAAMFSRKLAQSAMKAFWARIDVITESVKSRITQRLVVLAEGGHPFMYNGVIITDVNALPAEMRRELMTKMLNEQETETIALAIVLWRHHIDPRGAMIAWVGHFAHKLFGDHPTFEIDRVIVTGRDSAQSRLMDGASKSSDFWVITWVYEWGDWRIDGWECTRGCEARPLDISPAAPTRT